MKTSSVYPGPRKKRGIKVGAPTGSNLVPLSMLMPRQVAFNKTVNKAIPNPAGIAAKWAPQQP
jgi:hypothetical protein